MQIPLIKSSFFMEKQTRAELAQFVAQSDRFSMGDYCLQFERDFAVAQECTHAVFVSSGSMANLVLIQAFMNLGIFPRGYRVGISALTWSTSVMPLIQLGLIPVAIDCEPDTLNVSSRTLAEHVDDIDALFITNVLGFCDDIDGVERLCNAHNIICIEDNCESIGTRYRGRLSGNFGEASTFSFFVGHQMSTIEGGMICTNNTALYEMLLLVRSHGWDRNSPAAAQDALRETHGIDPFFNRYTFYDLGFNARPTEISGWLGVKQLPYLPEIIARREAHFARYQQALQATGQWQQLRTDHLDVVSNFAMPLIAHDETVADKAKQAFVQADVEIRPVLAGDITAQPFYRKYCAQARCPNTRHLHKNGFYIPNNPDLSEADVALLCSLIAKEY